jgi:hypothetical protein
MMISGLARALVAWQHAAGPWWPYVCAAPFLEMGEGTGAPFGQPGRDGSSAGPGYARAQRHRASAWSRRQVALVDRLLPLDAPAGDDHADEHAPERPSVVLVDVPAEPILALAPLLVERGWYVVPVIQRWIASPAVLPCRRLMRLLLAGSERVRRPASPRGVVLIADGERLGPPGYPLFVPGRAVDNRYEYQICRFPSVDFLHAREVRTMRWVTDRPPAQARPDLTPYLEDVLRAGIAVESETWEPGNDRLT